MVTDEGLEFESIGSDPGIEVTPIDFPEDMRLLVTIRMKSTVDQFGEFFYEKWAPPYAGPILIPFTITPDGEWHEYVIVIPSQGDNTILRVDPGVSPGHITVAWIRVESSRASTEATPGFSQYSLYDFSFEYPEGWWVLPSGLFESTATDNSGMIVIEHPIDDSVYVVSYIYSNIPLDPDDALEGNILAYDINTIEPRTSGTFKGHTIKRQELTTIILGDIYYMEWTAWYCDVNNRLFNIGYVSTENNALEQISQILSTFDCHT
jgi:hypothetical protein